MKKRNKFAAILLSAAIGLTPMTFQPFAPSHDFATVTASAATLSDMPSDYQYAADWIWNNRIMNEDSLGVKSKRWNSIFDQIVAGKGTINYVVKWQSYNTVTYEQRQQFEQMLSDCINAWNDWLAGYENWPYEHIDVKVVGWAVIDKSCLLDLHDDETVYTDTNYYDAQYDTSNGRDTIPDREPYAPLELSRFEHFRDTSYEYPGGLDKRFDMYMWATQGFPDIGGCGGDWGQRLSDTAYFGMINNGSLHVLEHEIGHGFGITDFYGGEGESDGYPPGGFPGGENSIMMAGSAQKITDFDGWMLRYMWSQIMNDTERFDLENAQPTTQEPTTQEPSQTTKTLEFTDTITSVDLNGSGGTIRFANNGSFTFSGTDFYSGDDSRNLAHYEANDRITIKLTYNEETGEIVSVDTLTLVSNAHNSGTGVIGDINADGSADVSDMVLLQKWLLAVPDTYLADWEAGDLSGNGKLDIYDLCLFRQLLAGGGDDPGDDPSDEGTLIASTVEQFGTATPSLGDVKMLCIYVDFADAKYLDTAYSNDQIKEELFGNGSVSAPYESVTAWYDRASYGNLHITGDVYRYTCSGNMEEYSQGQYEYEKMAMEVLKGLDSQINYADYDGDGDGIIDCISFTVPLDNASEQMKQYWYGCTGTWYQNPSFSVDNTKLSSYIIMDVMPNKSDMQYLKQTLIHEMGHSIGLPDYYKYNSTDYEGLHGDAGYERMDDSIGDFCSFSKLMYGWLKDTEVQEYTGSGTQTFELSDASQSGSCLILPITGSSGNYTSEYFLVEYITRSGNNADIYSSDEGVRIYHVQAEVSGTSFKYDNFSSYYMGDDKIRVLRLVNDNNGFYHSGDTVSYGTTNFAAYDSSGNQTINTGYTISIGSLSNGKYSVTVSK